MDDDLASTLLWVGGLASLFLWNPWPICVALAVIGILALNNKAN